MSQAIGLEDLPAPVCASCGCVIEDDEAEPAEADGPPILQYANIPVDDRGRARSGKNERQLSDNFFEDE